ncbi:Protein IMPACT [Bagarius yarrelli]|uniref:Protein IMPACT n=1 Tax=Bagarius yarrelli TaxID=175774 RepID=A0A556TSC6_BAGYA|nr:Protein IMPACT [Bagarius yarrelli]
MTEEHDDDWDESQISVLRLNPEQYLKHSISSAGTSDPDEVLPVIKHGEAITDRRSTFQPHLALVVTPKQILDVRNVLVVVSRWYGGILLGPDRFKHINNCARNILVQEGFTETLQAKGDGGKEKLPEMVIGRKKIEGEREEGRNKGGTNERKRERKKEASVSAAKYYTEPLAS